MITFINEFLLSFIPLFVAFDAPGILPLFVSFTDGMEEKERKTLVAEATLTAFFIGIVFILTGKVVFDFLGISDDDFRIAGGAVLVVLAINDLLFASEEKRRTPSSRIGVVPIGIPLIMGPAALTTLLILLDNHGFTLTILSLVSNLIITWVLFANSQKFVRLIGQGGSKAIAKVASLFIAAIGVKMIRMGVLNILGIE